MSISTCTGFASDSIRLVDIHATDQLPEFADAREAACYRMLLEMQDPSLLIDNVRARMRWAAVPGALMPVAIQDQAYDTSYVCSVYTAIVSSARVELQKVSSSLVRGPLRALLGCSAGLLKKAGIDRAVWHNNLMLPTNLYPAAAWRTGELATYIRTLVEHYPQHAIMFRCLNGHTNGDLMTALKEAGCRLVPCRQVYIFDRSLLDYTRKSHYQAGLRRLRNTKDYALAESDAITPHDYPRIVHLYNRLYIDKYNPYSPKFNERFVEAAHRTGFLEFVGLRNRHGVLDAFTCHCDRGNVTTTSFVGYDTDLPQQLGLFRMLMSHCIQRAETRGLILNLSSGVPEFKVNRGGMPFMEYTAIYTAHLKGLQKAAWRILNGLMIRVGGPVIRRFGL